MKKVSLYTILMLLSLPFILEAQNTRLITGADLHFKTESDYQQFEDEILLCIDWLETHSLDDKDRINPTTVFLTWMKGTPTHTVYYENYILNYTKKNPDFFVLFLSGWARYLIQNQDKETTDFEGNLAGVNALLDFYEKGEDYGVVKDKRIEKLLKKRTNNKLEKFIAIQIR